MRAAALLAGAVAWPVAVVAQERLFEFSYHMLAPRLPAAEAVDIYIPLPADHPGQHVLEQNPDANLPGDIGIEERHGNRAMPLNYVICLRVEVGGKPWRAELETAISYRAVTPG
jgi:hypothetical protein